jgi:hypothetical protein
MRRRRDHLELLALWAATTACLWLVMGLPAAAQRSNRRCRVLDVAWDAR